MATKLFLVVMLMGGICLAFNVLNVSGRLAELQSQRLVEIRGGNKCIYAQKFIILHRVIGFGILGVLLISAFNSILSL